MTRPRSGITAIETAFVLPIYFTLLLSSLDLGLMVFRQHAIDHAAGCVARRVVVHGEHADLTGKWGPTTIDEPATANEQPVIGELSDHLVCCDPSETRVLVEWTEGDNEIDSEVRVVITTVHSHLIPLLGSDPTLRAERSMRIQH